MKRYNVLPVIILPMLFLLLLSACVRHQEQNGSNQHTSAQGGGSTGGVSQPLPSDDTNANEGDAVEISAQEDDAEIRSLLQKGMVIRNLSYTAKFNSNDNEYIYEYYKFDNLTKMVIRGEDTQSISICDGKATVYYNLPEKEGYTMMEAGDDMGLVPNLEALLNASVYVFKTMGEESFSGYQCQVVETEDEFGVLKIWISKTLGFPIKYIGTDDNGWYSLELTEIQLGEPKESIFAIPPDVVIY